MIESEDKKYLPKLKYSYTKFVQEDSENESREITKLCHLLIVHNGAIGSNSPVFVTADDMFVDQFQNKSMILVDDLDKPNLRLYKKAIDFKLTDTAFPELMTAIEQSCRHELGWCHKTLRNKTAMDLYSRSILLKGENDMILEIWPPNHQSKIIQHVANTHGIIRILHNKLLIEFHPYLSVNPNQKPFLKQPCEHDEVMYIKPGLNQIYRLINPRSTLTLVIQAFDTDSFEYIDRGQIKQSKKLTDMDYEEFRKTMKIEWQQSKDNPSTASCSVGNWDECALQLAKQIYASLTNWENIQEITLFGGKLCHSQVRGGFHRWQWKWSGQFWCPQISASISGESKNLLSRAGAVEHAIQDYIAKCTQQHVCTAEQLQNWQQ
ncbi:unnamed protein product [Didymodactylos carnosus]|uniref:Uncharacterized protein n=1 Tax=Didymodactylos carnosus TaxID=1234261 RepID=A0A815CK69_9BILA|nr:unnamed protein product [Didymodactylos carnosus]CAF1281414.1 unnamed protein product [Didymodactylos carnosus]CAF3694030.1 unnamed protein product [Didymodactylos carnosus]CAF4077105.1 unnamed protein product [Didymodactylos carnosus]